MAWHGGGARRKKQGMNPTEHAAYSMYEILGLWDGKGLVTFFLAHLRFW